MRQFQQPSRRAAALFLVIGLAALAGPLPARAADTVITISNFAFTPAEVTVTVGTKVIFRNGDDTVHSVVADDGGFHSPALDSGHEFAFTFVRAGTFSFHCGLHPFMQGKIIVK